MNGRFLDISKKKYGGISHRGVERMSDVDNTMVLGWRKAVSKKGLGETMEYPEQQSRSAEGAAAGVS